ncbi:LacI family DNA-binding transcriptional regulator [Fimbriimonas ginsengisoli]|uniref:Transcriptional regulator, LacI family n=1 Tax=Fimbriimonas ginsengisoli Gsoil 348 TaxID=661478 RepID=A0A068NWW7_FIMGI|nr:substrate-binding domain-containing protein [Fimbriimonas ginsengisoli]AIE87936.1 transcriptional regulator, LacI family [Fimbriimonas ginsengisoli Gsoil 348]
MRNTNGDRRETPFQRILTDIEEQIGRADLSPGDVLPTRADLAKQYDVARATVDKALAELSRRGLIESGSGRRTLVLGKSAARDVVSTIGVLWNWPEDQERQGGDYLDLLFRGIREACAEYMLEVHFRSAPLHTWTELVQGKGAQGLLVVRPDYADATIIEGIHAAGVPVVLVPGVLDESPVPSISSNNASGAEAAVEHLYELGHRDIGFVGLTATVPDHFERLKAFLETTGRRGIAVRPEWICLAHERNPALFRERLGQWLRPDHYPTAVVSCDFMMTLAVLGRLRDLGLSVPEQISVVTFDDPPAAGQMHPSLTAVAQPIPLLGYRAIQRLREIVSGQEVPHIDRLATHLVVRESTAAPCR